MYRTVVGLPYSKAVFLSMAYVIHAFGDRQVESNIALGFTALETLVSAIGELDRTSYILEDDDFDPFAKAMKKAIKDYGKSQSWSSELKALLYKKLGELQRAPIIPRVVALVNSRSIEWEDLWPEGMALEPALQGEFNVRNTLIHTGFIEDPWRAIAAKYRVHALTERLLYSIIGGDPNWRDPDAYRHCRPLRHGLSWPASPLAD
jgi:hypothetical protein